MGAERFSLGSCGTMTLHEFSLGSVTDVLDEAGGYDFCAAATEIDGSGVIEGILCRDVKSAFVIDRDVRVRAEGGSGGGASRGKYRDRRPGAPRSRARELH